MTVLPSLRAALGDAAARRYGRRRGFVRRLPVLSRAAAGPLAGLGLAVCGVVVAIALIGDSPAGDLQGSASEQGVRPATLEASRALTRAPMVRPSGVADERPSPIAREDLSRVAADLQAQTPYPPGRRDALDLDGHSADMATISFRSDLQALIEHRAACLWARFWLDAQRQRVRTAQAAATTVLSDIPAWPTLRGAPSDDGRRTWRAVAHAAKAGDAQKVSEIAARQCREM